MAIECNDTFGISFTVELVECDLEIDNRDTYQLTNGLNEIRKTVNFRRNDATTGDYKVELTYAVTNAAAAPTTAKPTGLTINKAVVNPTKPDFNVGGSVTQHPTVEVDIVVDRAAFAAAGHTGVSITVDVGLDR